MMKLSFKLLTLFSDPKQRLALFRKLEESTKLKPVQPPSRKQTQRKEYFQGIYCDIAASKFDS